jgi:hypothetical protein
MSIARHISQIHKEITIKEYYDRYLKKDIDGLCIVCGNNTSFINLNEGYNKTCSHKCGGIYHRQQLKNDDSKNIVFIEKVKYNQTRIWKERENTGEKEIILEKVMSRVRETIEHMTEDERKERFGWMNKLTEEEKQVKVKEILNKSLFKWYAEASEEDKNAVYKRKIETQILNGNCIDRKLLSEWDNYKMDVRVITERNYKKYKNIINPTNLIRGKGEGKYELDHIVSIFDGFKNNIPPEIIATPCNLQMLKGQINNSKNTNSWMSIEELLLKWQDTIINATLRQKTLGNI